MTVTDMTLVLDERLTFDEVEATETGFRVASYEERLGDTVTTRDGNGNVCYIEVAPSTYIYHLRRQP